MNARIPDLSIPHNHRGLAGGLMKGDFDASMERIFKTREAFERSLPDRVWIRTRTGWMSKDRKMADELGECAAT